MATMSNYVQQLINENTAANKANQDRLNDILTMYDKMINMYGESGSWTTAQNKAIEQSRQKAMSTGMANLVGTGMSKTSLAATMPLAWESEVGTGLRANLENTRTSAITNLLQGKAGVLERVEETGPDTSTIASLMSQNAAATASSGGKHYGASSFKTNYQDPSEYLQTANALQPWNQSTTAAKKSSTKTMSMTTPTFSSQQASTPTNSGKYEVGTSTDKNTGKTTTYYSDGTSSVSSASSGGSVWSKALNTVNSAFKW